MNIKEKFGEKVKHLREEKKFSIEHFANISDVDRNYLSDIEKGKRNVSIEVIEKIINALDIDFAIFFNDKTFEISDGSRIQELCESAGVPFNCRSGNCGTCQIEIKTG